VSSPLGDTIATRSNTICQQFCVWSISLFFYASDRDDPVHIHVERDEKVAKYWLDPARLQNSSGFNRLELKQILLIIKENQASFMETWNE